MRASGGKRNESGRREEEEAMMMTASMLSCKGRCWGYRANDVGKEEVMEMDNNDEPFGASGGGATWRCCTAGGGWTSATPMLTAPKPWWGVVIDKLFPLLIYC